MSSCTSKPKFQTQEAAQAALKSTVPGLKTCYLCQDCGMWHLGQEPRTKKVRKVRKLAHYARR